MTKKRNGFWAFCFSLLPGAGEMYMGFMKMGISLMGLFFGLIALSIFFQQAAFMFADVIVWFYGFFHVHNLRGMDDEEFYATEDDYLFHLDDTGREFWNKAVVTRYRKIIAAVLILFGVSIVWNNLIDMLMWMVPDYVQNIFYNISYRIPQMVLGIGIIAVGVLMIRGKKKELLEEGTDDGRETDGEDA